MKKAFFIALVALFVSMSCKSTKEIQSSDKTSQQYSLTKETKWILTSFNGKSTQEAGFKKRTPFIILDKQAGRISGHSGCNSFNGKTEIGDSTIKTGMLMSTKAFCMGVPEHVLFKYLEEIDSYKIDGNKLLLTKGKDVLLEFAVSSE